jgi:triosephosphate isomerase
LPEVKLLYTALPSGYYRGICTRLAGARRAQPEKTFREESVRKYFIAGNWKMHKTVAESVELAKVLRDQLSGCGEKLMIAPAFTALDAVGKLIKGTNILLGAQNMGPEEQGAHTGEVSVLMLKDLGVEVLILGHSERRHSYLETDALINRKVLLALKHGLEVILCVGETLEEREGGRLEAVVGTQTREGLKGVALEYLSRVTIAYEPVWAIGTGKTATPDDADAVHAYIRKVLTELYGAAEAKRMPIQYGGSVKPDNVKELMAKPNIDGALVGGAALKPESFVPIAKFR